MTLILLRTTGRNLGIAFQLVDDSLDYSAQQVTLGKTVGDDFREGKVTLPVLMAYQKGKQQDRDFWTRTIKDGDLQDGDLELATALMQQSGTFEEVRNRARGYISAACDELACFPESENKQALIDAAKFCVRRVY